MLGRHSNVAVQGLEQRNRVSRARETDELVPRPTFLTKKVESRANQVPQTSRASTKSVHITLIRF